jgi:phosphoribosylaminoimidazolecarboxamide formyltransferase/IMP cyclohydrolase
MILQIVTNSSGLDRLAAYLAKKGVKMVASGGTAKELRRLGHPCTDVSEWTQSPEILDGRVKTLHPRIHAALLAKRSSQVDMDCLRGMKLPQIDLVVVNLYGFEKSPAVENIDVGGPSMLRAAAKNFQWVTVLSNPSQYDAFMDACSGNGGRTTLAFRKDCAAQVFRLCSQFDEAVGDFLGGTLKEPKDRSASALTTLPPRLKLRYGENPQQGATLHYPSDPPYRVLQGKEISYNNLCDMQAAIQIAFGAKKYFGTENVHCAVIKHQTRAALAAESPCLKHGKMRSQATRRLLSVAWLHLISRSTVRRRKP